MRGRGGGLFLAALCVLVPAAAGAACSLQGIVGLSFGTYSPASAVPLDTVGSVGYRCDLLQLSVVHIDLSSGNSGSYAARQMQGPSTNKLSYNLYMDATHLTVWGDGSSGTSRYGPVLPILGADVSLPVYGRIPELQNVAAGAYSDTVVVTLTF
ncbi:SCPU domain-containing protein [Corallococcus sp. H22C18031201]|nr:spore coat U domain-containing protein [Citreicoccus inhibens]RJS24165.1 SCPU domain-containing protein [Corallococcus sp. H22C18031201]